MEPAQADFRVPCRRRGWWLCLFVWRRAWEIFGNQRNLSVSGWSPTIEHHSYSQPYMWIPLMRRWFSSGCEPSVGRWSSSDKMGSSRCLTFAIPHILAELTFAIPHIWLSSLWAQISQGNSHEDHISKLDIGEELRETRETAPGRKAPGTRMVAPE